MPKKGPHLGKAGNGFVQSPYVVHAQPAHVAEEFQDSLPLAFSDAGRDSCSERGDVQTVRQTALVMRIL